MFDQRTIAHVLHPVADSVVDFLLAFKARAKRDKDARLSIDLETTGLDPLVGEITIIGMSYDGKQVVLAHPDRLPVELFNEIMADPALCKVMHNAKFDMKWLMHKYGTEFENTDCTQIMRRMLVTGIQGAKATLEVCAQTYLGCTMDKTVTQQFVGQTEINQVMADYAALDVAATWSIWTVLHELVTNEQLTECYELIERPLIPIVAHMELDGIDVDLKFLKMLEVLLKKKIIRFQAELDHIVRSFGAMPTKTRKLLVRERAQWAVDNGRVAPLEIVEELDTLAVNSSKQVVHVLNNIGFVMKSSAKEAMEEPFYSPASVALAAKRLEVGAFIDNSPVAICSDKPETKEQKLKRLMAQLAAMQGQTVEPEPDDEPLELEAVWKEGMTTDEVLEVGYDVIQRILDLRAAEKALNGFVIPLQTVHISTVTGKIHTHLNQLDTATGRFSNKQPNFQQMPSKRKKSVFDGFEFRRAFIPPAGCAMFVIDYSACEIRILAELTQEPNLLYAVTFTDPHVANAMIMFDKTEVEILADHKACELKGIVSMRQKAKTCFFTLVYGGGAKRVAAQLKCTVAQAQALIDSVFIKFPGVRKWIDQKKAGAIRDGFVVSLSGRKRYFNLPAKPEWKDNDSFNYSVSSRSYRGAISGIERQAQNSPVQGTNADIIKLAMVLGAAALKPFNGRLLLTVHDELVAVAPLEYAEEAYKALEGAMLEAEREFLVRVDPKVDGKIASFWEH